MFDTVELIGSGTIADRLFAKPAVAVLGFDAPAVAGSSNQIVPEASARVSLRLAPGDDPERARDALVAHLRAAAPWGVQVEIEADEAGMGYLVDTTHPGVRGGEGRARRGVRSRGGRDGQRRLGADRPDACRDLPGHGRADRGAPATSARTTTRSTRASTSPTSSGSCSPRPCSSATWAPPSVPEPRSLMTAAAPWSRATLRRPRC